MKASRNLVVLTFLALALGLPGGNAWSWDRYGDDVNAFCTTSPYTGDCALCHTGSKGAQTTAKDEFMAGNLCYFCPDDAVCGGVGGGCTDRDGDGWCLEDGDCNDNDPLINPGLAEVCGDRKDNDCNGQIDGLDAACVVVPPTCTDLDQDGYSIEGDLCGPVDCNDSDATIFPGAAEICQDGVDQDCSGRDKTKGKGCAKATTTGGSEGKGKTCSDGEDNDLDGAIDCSDSDCAGNRACR